MMVTIMVMVAREVLVTDGGGGHGNKGHSGGGSGDGGSERDRKRCISFFLFVPATAMASQELERRFPEIWAEVSPLLNQSGESPTPGVSCTLLRLTNQSPRPRVRVGRRQHGQLGQQARATRYPGGEIWSAILSRSPACFCIRDVHVYLSVVHTCMYIYICYIYYMRMIYMYLCMKHDQPCVAGTWTDVSLFSAGVRNDRTCSQMPQLCEFLERVLPEVSLNLCCTPRVCLSVSHKP